MLFTSGSLLLRLEETEEIETIFTVAISGFQMWHHRLVCTTGLQTVSSKTNTADELWKHLCGPQIFFFVRAQHLSVQDNGCTEATQLCVHTLQGPTAAGSAYSKHGSRLHGNISGQEDGSCKSAEELKRLLVSVLALQTQQAILKVKNRV